MGKVEMPAGRELDALICVRVMKTHTVWDRKDGTPEQQEWGKLVDVRNGALRGYDDIPEYSTDIGAAWEVTSKMLADGWRFVISSREATGTGWWAGFERPAHWESRSIRSGKDFAETAPLAICRAALKTLGDE